MDDDAAADGVRNAQSAAESTAEELGDGIVPIEDHQVTEVRQVHKRVNVGRGAQAAEPGLAGSTRGGDYSGLAAAATGAAKPPNGFLSSLYRKINNRLIGRLLGTYLDSRGGPITYNNGVTEHRTRTQTTERAVQKPTGKATANTPGSRPTKPTRVESRFGFGWNVIFGLFDDFGVWERAQENGNTFDEQLMEEGNESKYVFPLGIPLPLENPYYHTKIDA